MSEDAWQDLGSFNDDWYYMKVIDQDIDCDGYFECKYEIYKNDDDEPVFKNDEDEPFTGDLPENIIKDIKKVIERLKHEYRDWLYQPD